MEWGKKENRAAIIVLHKCNKTPAEIFELLHPLNITNRFIYRTIKRYKETSSVNDRPRSGRPREIRTPAAVKAVAERIKKNPLSKSKVIAKEMEIPARSLARIIKEDLKLKRKEEAS